MVYLIKFLRLFILNKYRIITIILFFHPLIISQEISNNSILCQDIFKTLISIYKEDRNIKSKEVTYLKTTEKNHRASTDFSHNNLLNLRAISKDFKKNIEETYFIPKVSKILVSPNRLNWQSKTTQYKQHYKTVLLFIEDINQSIDESNNTLLHQAAFYNDLQGVEYLIARKANSKKNKLDHFPINLYLKNNYGKILERRISLEDQEKMIHYLVDPTKKNLIKSFFKESIFFCNKIAIDYFFKNKLDQYLDSSYIDSEVDAYFFTAICNDHIKDELYFKKSIFDYLITNKYPIEKILLSVFSLGIGRYGCSEYKNDWLTKDSEQLDLTNNNKILLISTFIRDIFEIIKKSQPENIPQYIETGNNYLNREKKSMLLLLGAKKTSAIEHEFRKTLQHIQDSIVSYIPYENLRDCPIILEPQNNFTLKKIIFPCFTLFFVAFFYITYSYLHSMQYI